jgi:hypothetical protein
MAVAAAIGSLAVRARIAYSAEQEMIFSATKL